MSNIIGLVGGTGSDVSGFNPAVAGWLQVVVIFAVLCAGYVLLGGYLARVFTSTHHWRLEKVIYRICVVNPDREQRGTQ
jgi:potassium-transporting ATPase potassium-binding subunit